MFEGDWDGETLWRVPAGGGPPAKVAAQFTNDNSPCVLPDGRIASLWLGGPGGGALHELKIMAADGSSYFVLPVGGDIADIGIGCGE